MAAAIFSDVAVGLLMLLLWRLPHPRCINGVME